MIARPGPLAALAVLAGLSPAARAQPGGGPPLAAPPLAVRAPTPACASAPAFLAFVESLRVELASSGPACCAIVAADAATAPETLTLALTDCNPGAEDFAVEVADRARGLTRSRRIALADVAPDARPRALALAVAELVRSIERAADERPPPAAPPPGHAGAPTTAAPPETVARGAALAGVRDYPGTGSALWGGRVALSVERGRWRGELDLGAARGVRQVSLGTIAVTLASAGLALGPRFIARGWTFDVGPAGEVGWARIDGQPGQAGVTGGSGSGLTAALGVQAGAEAPAAASLRLRVAIEAGGVMRRFTGDENGEAAAGISGGYLGISLGAAAGL